MNQTNPTGLTHQNCPRCSSSFECAGCLSADCWCMAYPAIFACAADAKCVCSACLTVMTAEHINTHIDTKTVHDTAPTTATACEGMPLIENLDYTIENGHWVLSRWYLLKRGDCCGNACRNCPYGHTNVQPTSQKRILE